MQQPGVCGGGIFGDYCGWEVGDLALPPGHGATAGASVGGGAGVRVVTVGGAPEGGHRLLAAPAMVLVEWEVWAGEVGEGTARGRGGEVRVVAGDGVEDFTGRGGRWGGGGRGGGVSEREEEEFGREGRRLEEGGKGEERRRSDQEGEEEKEEDFRPQPRIRALRPNSGVSKRAL